MVSKSVNKAAGLRALTYQSFITKTYLYMFASLILTALVCYLTIETGLFKSFISGKSLSLLGLGVQFLPLGLMIFLWTKKIETMSVNTARLFFFGFAISFGLMLSLVIFQTAPVVVFQSLIGTAGVFSGAALVGYYVKKDLSFLNQVAYIAFWGMFIATIFSLFIGFGNTFHTFISYGIIIASAVFVAYTNQNLKIVHQYYSTHSDETEKIAIFGALSLYIDFVNIFISLLDLANRK